MRALPQLAESGVPIGHDDPDAAARVVARLVASVDMLAELPAVGRIGRIPRTHEVLLSVIPDIIPYRVRQDIEITTVMPSFPAMTEEAVSECVPVVHTSCDQAKMQKIGLVWMGIEPTVPR